MLANSHKTVAKQKCKNTSHESVNSIMIILLIENYGMRIRKSIITIVDDVSEQSCIIGRTRNIPGRRTIQLGD